jgi:hypothetical protein
MEKAIQERLSVKGEQWSCFDSFEIFSFCIDGMVVLLTCLSLCWQVNMQLLFLS